MKKQKYKNFHPVLKSKLKLPYNVFMAWQKSYSADMEKAIIEKWQITTEKIGIVKTMLNFFGVAKRLANLPR